MKPKTRIMAVSTMLGVTIAFGALFFYIEEKKFEAHAYKKELEKLQAAYDNHDNSSFHYLIEQLASQAPNNGTLATLQRSNTISNLDANAISSVIQILKNNLPEQAQQILQKQYALNSNEIAAINMLLQN